MEFDDGLLCSTQPINEDSPDKFNYPVNCSFLKKLAAKETFIKTGTTKRGNPWERPLFSPDNFLMNEASYNPFK